MKQTDFLCSLLLILLSHNANGNQLNLLARYDPMNLFFSYPIEYQANSVPFTKKQSEASMSSFESQSFPRNASAFMTNGNGEITGAVHFQEMVRERERETIN